MTTKKETKYLCGAFAAAFGFTILSQLIILQSNLTRKMDQSVCKFVHVTFGQRKMTFGENPINDLMTLATMFGDATVIVALAIIVAIILALVGKRYLAGWLVSLLAVGGGSGIVVKKLIGRERPTYHLPIDDGYSFPSGHAVAATLFLLAVWLVIVPMIKQLSIRVAVRIVLGVLWLLILLSRLYFGAHYLIDLVAGCLFGFAWLLLAMYVLERRHFNSQFIQRQ
ncbi:phosphatase PAP2 family protein [Weissella confusa]|uniref:phosphatase PAP2 family protein n=1 Tax=Weissella confusa TaxID=1583 RepID=UPI00223B6AE6|nr:phosphatase PAP2 family protein [Weissella confusa]MCT0947970.1 phosphatase PAP2 family protein [Weissella confusa]